MWPHAQGLVDAHQLWWVGYGVGRADFSWDDWYALLLTWRDDPAMGKGEHCNVPTQRTAAQAP